MNTETTKFYMVMNNDAVWGAGRTIEEAKVEACTWIEDADGRQGVTMGWLHDRLVTEREFDRDPADKFFIFPVSCVDFDDDIKEIDTDKLMDVYYIQRNQDQ